MKEFKVTRIEEYTVNVDSIGESLAKSDVDVQTSFIAKYFEALDKKTIDEIAKQLTASDYHRGKEEIKALSSAIEYYGYQK